MSNLIYSTNGINKTTQNEIHYDPIFTTMYKEGLVDPYFSMAISRDTSGDGGYLTLGGLPPIDFNETWTSTDIYVTDIEGYVKHLDFYTLHVDDITVGDKVIKKAGGKNTYIVRHLHSHPNFNSSLTTTLRSTLAPA